MMVKVRRMIEREIAQQIVDDALAAGYGLSLQADGEEFEPPTLDGKQIMATLMDVDYAFLVLHGAARTRNPSPNLGTDAIGWVHFVFGNDGYDCISDYTMNLESLLSKANDIADKYAD